MNAPDVRFSPENPPGQTAKSGAVCFTISAAQQPCGIDMFQRELARATEGLGTATRCVVLGGAGQGVSQLWSALRHAPALVVSLPIVAWKRAIVTPFVALFMARLRGVKTIVVLHEWADLNPLRRAVMSLYLVCAQSVLISSPSIERGFAKSFIARLVSKRHLIPIPPNLAPPPAARHRAPAERSGRDRRDKGFVIGQFGSIYPKKQSEFVLDVAASLRKNGHDARVVFIGSFIKGHEDLKTRFWARVKALGLEGFVTVTGYVGTSAEIFDLFETIDVFVYAFREGLTSRRGSVLTCIQSGRPVVVNEAGLPGEFDHHPVFRQAMQSGLVQLVPTHADAQAYADAIAGINLQLRNPVADIFGHAWQLAALSLLNANDPEHSRRRTTLQKSAAVDARV